MARSMTRWVRACWHAIAPYAARGLAVTTGLVVLAFGLDPDQSAERTVPLTLIGVAAVLIGAFLPHISELTSTLLSVKFRPPNLGPDVHRLRQERRQPQPGVQPDALGLPIADDTYSPGGGMSLLDPDERQDPPRAPIDADAIDLPGDDDAWVGARYLVGERAIELLLTDLTGALSGCEAKVYVYDADLKKLVPAYCPTSAAAAWTGAWELGQGVTGHAYKTRRYAYAEGDNVHNATYRLTPAQQRQYAYLKAVAAAPLADPSGNMLGVLSLSSESPATRLTTDDGYRAHLALAEQVSVVLVELLGFSA